MLEKLIIFVVDLTLASAIFIILYAVYLTVATSIFISAFFYIFKGEMEQNHDFSEGRTWVLNSSNAARKPFAGNIERVSSRMVPVHLLASRERATLPEENGSLF